MQDPISSRGLNCYFKLYALSGTKTVLRGCSKNMNALLLNISDDRFQVRCYVHLCAFRWFSKAFAGLILPVSALEQPVGNGYKVETCKLCVGGCVDLK